jgi:2'-5' RNA ligase
LSEVSEARLLRLFFALWPPDSIRGTLAEAVGPLREAEARAVTAANLHVTLIFLGQTDPNRLTGLLSVADRIEANPFELRLDRVESWRAARVLALVPSEMPHKLLELHRTLNERLAEAGFATESREYGPHLTLARDFQRRLEPQFIKPIVWPVDEFVLVQSRPLPSGASYEVIARWRLNANG